MLLVLLPCLPNPPLYRKLISCQSFFSPPCPHSLQPLYLSWMLSDERCKQLFITLLFVLHLKKKKKSLYFKTWMHGSASTTHCKGIFPVEEITSPTPAAPLKGSLEQMVVRESLCLPCKHHQDESPGTTAGESWHMKPTLN